MTKIKSTLMALLLGLMTPIPVQAEPNYPGEIRKAHNNLNNCLEGDLTKVTEDYDKMTSSKCQYQRSGKEACALINTDYQIESCMGAGECCHYNMTFLREGYTYGIHYNCNGGGVLTITKQKGKQGLKNIYAQDHAITIDKYADGSKGNQKANELELSLLKEALNICQKETKRRKEILYKIIQKNKSKH